MLPRKIFESLHTVMAILVLFEQISGKVWSCFWPLILRASSNMTHLFAQSRLCVLKATKAYCYEEVRIMEKFYSSKAVVANLFLWPGSLFQ